jgi:hypothetical protein
MRLSTFQRDLVGLIDLLVSSPGRWIFILEPGESDRYLQMLVYEDGSIFAEAVSNNFLEGPDRLSAEEEAALGAIGWNEPRLPDKPNWWAVQATIYPDTSKLADLVLGTLGGCTGCAAPIWSLASCSIRPGAAIHRHPACLTPGQLCSSL